MYIKEKKENSVEDFDSFLHTINNNENIALAKNRQWQLEVFKNAFEGIYDIDLPANRQFNNQYRAYLFDIGEDYSEQNYANYLKLVSHENLENIENTHNTQYFPDVNGSPAIISESKTLGDKKYSRLTKTDEVLMNKEFETRKREYKVLIIKRFFAFDFYKKFKSFRKIDEMALEEFKDIKKISDIADTKAVGMMNETKFICSLANYTYNAIITNKKCKLSDIRVMDMGSKEDHNKIDFTLSIDTPINKENIKKETPFGSLVLNKKSNDLKYRHYLPMQFGSYKNLKAPRNKKLILEKKLFIWRKGGAAIIMQNDELANFYFSQTDMHRRTEMPLLDEKEIEEAKKNAPPEGYSDDEAIKEVMKSIFDQIKEIDDLLKEAERKNYKINREHLRVLRKEDYEKMKMAKKNIETFKEIYDKK